MRIVLDTSILIATDVPEIDGELAISAASLAELHFGVLVATDPERRAERLRRVTQIERLFDPLPIDAAVAASFGRLAAATAASGRQPRARTMDLLIAATAHAHGAALCTRDRDTAVHLSGLVSVLER